MENNNWLSKEMEKDEVLAALIRNVKEMEQKVARGLTKNMSFVERMRPTQMFYNYMIMKLGGSIDGKVIEDAAREFADMVAKCLTPDTKILEQLSPPSSGIEVDGDRWEYKIDNDGK